MENEDMVPADGQLSGHHEPVNVTFVDLHTMAIGALNARSLSQVGFASLRPIVSEGVLDPEWAPTVEHVHELNANAVVRVFGLIEGFIQALNINIGTGIPNLRAQLDAGIRKGANAANNSLREEGASEEKIRTLTDFGNQVYRAVRPNRPAMRLNTGVATTTYERWNDCLERVLLRQRPGCAVPDDLKAVISEIGEIRNVIVHRMDRIDSEALAAVVEGPWREVNDRVILTDEIYAVYMAALWTVVDEIHDRILLQSDHEPRFATLDDWRDRRPPTKLATD